MLSVLAHLLLQPSSEQYIDDLCAKTGLRSDSVARVLRRFEAQGWVVSEWEDELQATNQGRPPRHLFKLTSLGLKEGWGVVEKVFPERLVTPPRERPGFDMEL
jgi:DNA-binding PadR family transcriptional regulator